MGNHITERKISIYGDSEGVVGFTVFGEPVAKQRPRTVRNKKRNGKIAVHTYTPSKTKNQEEKIALVYKLIYGGFKFDKNVPLMMSCKFYFKIPGTMDGKYVNKSMKEKMISGEIRPTKKKDVDNLIKTVADGANGVIYEDDSQIVEMTASKYWSYEPRTEIFIARLDDD